MAHEKHMPRVFIALAAALVLSACQAAAPAPSGQPLIGSWGGQHIGLELTAEGGALDYDCAAGAIEGPVIPDPAGRFTARGTHAPGHGGPDRIGETPPQIAAEYSGRVTGGRMTLAVRVPGLELGPFNLERDAAPTILRCL